MDNPVEIKAQLKAFGCNLKRARVARKTTLKTLSSKVNLNIRNLQRIEVGELNILMTTVLRLKQELGCSWYELFPASGGKHDSIPRSENH